MTLRDIAHSLFAEAIAKQGPSSIVYESSKKYDAHFHDATRIFPVAVGKASVEMMSGLLDYLNENHPSKIYKRPIVVSNPQETTSLHDFTHIVSSHPTPDASSLNAARMVLDYINQSSETDLAIFLISGGGSSLLSLPADGISLDDKVELTQLLLASGCNINDINTVRKHVSQIKGGRLNSAALPSKSISLLISDVINDDLSSIASGPTVADETTFHDAINILNKYKFTALYNQTSPLYHLISQSREKKTPIREYSLKLTNPIDKKEQEVDIQVSPFEDTEYLLLMFIERGIAKKFNRQYLQAGSAKSLVEMSSILAHEIKNPLTPIQPVSYTHLTLPTIYSV